MELVIGRQFADEIAPVAEGRAYRQSIFINCPFDDDYKPLFEAAVFTVIRCGYIARCAKERDDSSEPRFNTILTMIEECQFGIHDLSRIKLDRGYPRFNMPLELGLFLGAKRYGRRAQDQKRCLIFERDPHTYDKFLSDMSGHDIKSHGNKPEQVVREVRDWLSKNTRKTRLLGGHALWLDYRKFKSWLRGKCASASQRVDDLTWEEFVRYCIEWKKEQANR